VNFFEGIEIPDNKHNSRISHRNVKDEVDSCGQEGFLVSFTLLLLLLYRLVLMDKNTYAGEEGVA
jgi:hypothetical protein